MTIGSLFFAPCPRADARKFVAEHHSHHRAHLGDVFAIGCYSPDLVAVVVVSRPVARLLSDRTVMEVTRLCVGPDAPKFAASGHDRRNAGSFLPGMYEASSEPVDRVRWEIGPDASGERVDVQVRSA